DKDKLSDFKEFKGGYVAFGNDSKGGFSSTEAEYVAAASCCAQTMRAPFAL
ncbi:hypothetical protein Tco_0960130, partial [Tanacetum coccineum]